MDNPYFERIQQYPTVQHVIPSSILHPDMTLNHQPLTVSDAALESQTLKILGQVHLSHG